MLHNAMKKAVQWGLIGRNPTEAASVPRPERAEMKTLDEDQVRRLFEATKDDTDHALWVLLATTGARLGEALGLKWQDVDLVQSRLMIRRALQRQKGKAWSSLNRRPHEADGPSIFRKGRAARYENTAACSSNIVSLPARTGRTTTSSSAAMTAPRYSPPI